MRRRMRTLLGRFLAILAVVVLIGPLEAQPAANGTGNLLPEISQLAGWTFPNGTVDKGTATSTVEADTVKVIMTGVSDAPSVRVMYTGFLPTEGGTYTLRFRAKADGEHRLVFTGEQGPPWVSLGLAATCQLTPEWRTFTRTFTVKGFVGSHHILPEFWLGQKPGTVWLKGITLVEGTEIAADKNLLLPLNHTAAGIWVNVGEQGRNVRMTPLGQNARAEMSIEGNVAKIVVSRVDRDAWYTHLIYNPDLTNGQYYTLKFRAKADAPRPLDIFSENGAPSLPLGLRQKVYLTTDWQAYQLTFKARNAIDGQNNVPEIVFGSLPGVLWLTDVALVPGALPALPTSGAFNPLPVSERSLQLRVQDKSDATMSLEGKDIRVDVNAVTNTVWHVQAFQEGISLKEGVNYILKYRAKASVARTASIVVSLDNGDYHSVGLQAEDALTTEWQTFTHRFQAVGTQPGHTQLAFNLGQAPGSVWISRVSLEPAP